ncbi:hypothetical protein [Erythrobacter aureus]|uniref:hypothetical protein n=1 Tax=Erythrobacter aureus TaxID=2182384 RepID=UPI003A8F2358
MNTWGSPRKIFEAVDRMEMPEQLPTEIADALEFWRDRYWSNGEPTFAFEALNFTNDDQRAFVEQVLTGDRHSDGDCVKALLLIILRLRNNLFHGAKWRYRLQGQFDNFSHANGVLMRATEFAVPEPIADDL